MDFAHPYRLIPYFHEIHDDLQAKANENKANENRDENKSGLG